MFKSTTRFLRSNIRYYSQAAAKDCKLPDKAAAQKPTDTRKVVKVYRYDGILCKTEPRMQTYDVDTSTCGAMMLDLLRRLKEMDPTLTFRRSCREGICGSCGICVQGQNCLACTHAIPSAKVITVHPLPHMYVIRDLVVDMTHFLNAYDSIRPYLIRKQEFPLGIQQFAQSTDDANKFIGLYECILCGCCSTSCPSYWWNGRRFLGPAALLHAYRWIIDSRDEETQKRLHHLRDDFKAFRCHTILNCTLACPKKLHPALYIAKLKRLISGVDKKPSPEIDPLKFMSGGGRGGLEACLQSMKNKKKVC